MIEGLVEWGAAEAAELLGVPDVQAHKYSRGVLGLKTGSAAFPGAAVLGAEAAWRTGAGLVRFVPQFGDAVPLHGLPSAAAAVLAARPETVFSRDFDEDRARCDAWVLGSGTDPSTRDEAETAALTKLLADWAVIVADAGALDLLGSTPLHAPLIATPHLGEFRELWQAAELGELHDKTEDERHQAAVTLARHLQITVLLKGSRTIVAAPDGFALVCGPATPWLATAGTGDVLAGALGALVAARGAEVSADVHMLAKLGATAAVLHDHAARIASHDTEASGAGHPVTALDVARTLGTAFEQIRG